MISYLFILFHFFVFVCFVLRSKLIIRIVSDISN